MFGEDSVTYQKAMKYLTVTVDKNTAVINMKTYEVQCKDEVGISLLDFIPSFFFFLGLFLIFHITGLNDVFLWF